MNLSRKKILIISGVVLALILVVTMILAIKPAQLAFKSWRFNRDLHTFVDAQTAFQQADYLAAMADTYGGKTPQETLQMYIDAVEKGDYELASKYFIGANQAKELNSFNGATKFDIDNVQNLLKQALKNEGSYSTDLSQYVIHKPLLVNFKKYPNNVWKIIEI